MIMNGDHSLISQIKQGIYDMCHIWAKEMRSVFADEGVLLFFIFLPLFYPVLYSWIYNNEVVNKVPVAIVDLSHSHDSREFVRKVDACSGVRVAYYCNNLEEAREVVGHQKAHGILYFPSDFATKLHRGEQAHVGVYCDMSLMLTYKAILQSAQAVSMEMGSQIQIAGSNSFTARDEEIATRPLDFDEVPIFNATGGYGNAILPGVLMLILQQSLLLGIGLAAGTARENNRYQDLVPITSHHNGIFRIVLGKAMCYFMIYAVAGAYITLCVPPLLPLHHHGPGRSAVGSHGALSVGLHLLWHDAVVSGALSRKCDAAGGVYLGTSALHDGHQLACKQYPRRVEGRVAALPVDLRCEGLPHAQQHGRHARRHHHRIYGIVGSGGHILLCHLCGLSSADYPHPHPRLRTPRNAQAEDQGGNRPQAVG